GRGVRPCERSRGKDQVKTRGPIAESSHRHDVRGKSGPLLRPTCLEKKTPATGSVPARAVHHSSIAGRYSGPTLFHQGQNADAGPLGTPVDNAHVAVARDRQVKRNVLRTDVRLSSVTGHLQKRVRHVEGATDVERSVALDRYGLGGVACLKQGQTLIDAAR